MSLKFASGSLEETFWLQEGSRGPDSPLVALFFISQFFGLLFPFPTLFACLPSFLLFSSSFFPNPFLLQREEEQTFFLYTSFFILLSFALALANVGLKKSFKIFYVPSASHMNFWENQFLESMEFTLSFMNL